MTDLMIGGVRKRRGGPDILAGIDLLVPHGQIVALLGASGSGKTTLLRLIAGFDRCDAGRIALGDILVDGGPAFVPPERRGIGYVPQEGLLFPHLTAGGNVGFGLSRAERRAGRVAETLGLVGLDAEMGRRHPHQLSGGQQQRVALARALAPRPRVVLLDEPFNGLDGTLRRSVAADVSAVLRKATTTAVLVTHDPLEAFACADTIAVMREGRIVQHAEPVTLYRRPADIRVARLTGPTLELHGRVRGGEADTALGRLPVFSPDGIEGEARILLRPEQVVVAGSEGVKVEVHAAVFCGDHTQVTVQAGQDHLDLRLTGSLADPLRVAVTGVGLAFRP